MNLSSLCVLSLVVVFCFLALGETEAFARVKRQRGRERTGEARGRQGSQEDGTEGPMTTTTPSPDECILGCTHSMQRRWEAMGMRLSSVSSLSPQLFDRETLRDLCRPLASWQNCSLDCPDTELKTRLSDGFLAVENFCTEQRAEFEKFQKCFAEADPQTNSVCSPCGTAEDQEVHTERLDEASRQQNMMDAMEAMKQVCQIASCRANCTMQVVNDVCQNREAAGFLGRLLQRGIQSLVRPIERRLGISIDDCQAILNFNPDVLNLDQMTFTASQTTLAPETVTWKSWRERMDAAASTEASRRAAAVTGASKRVEAERATESSIRAAAVTEASKRVEAERATASSIIAAAVTEASKRVEAERATQSSLIAGAMTEASKRAETAASNRAGAVTELVKRLRDDDSTTVPTQAAAAAVLAPLLLISALFFTLI